MPVYASFVSQEEAESEAGAGGWQGPGTAGTQQENGTGASGHK